MLSPLCGYCVSTYLNFNFKWLDAFYLSTLWPGTTLPIITNIGVPCCYKIFPGIPWVGHSINQFIMVFVVHKSSEKLMDRVG